MHDPNLIIRNKKCLNSTPTVLVTGTVIFITLITGGITGIGRIVTTVFALAVPVVSSVITALIVILQGHIVVHLALVK